MRVNMHHPRVIGVVEHDNFRTIKLSDHDTTDGDLTLFIDTDWSEWDAIVAAVEAHRNGTA